MSLALLAQEGSAWKMALNSGKKFLKQECHRAAGISPFQVPHPHPSPHTCLLASLYRKVESVERADKNYFIVLTPKRNTIADVALEKL